MGMSRSDLEHDLADHVVGEDWQIDEEGRVRQPADPAEATRLLVRLRTLRDDSQQISALADERVARIESWRSDRLAGIHKIVAASSAALEGFFRWWSSDHSNLRTLDLADGKLRLRAPSKRGRIVVTDEVSLIEWGRQATIESEITRIAIDALQKVLELGTPEEDTLRGTDVEDARKLASEALTEISARTIAALDEQAPVPVVTLEPKVHRNALNTDQFVDGEFLGATVDGEHRFSIATVDGEPVPGVERVVGTSDSFSYDLET
jgi:hypothetical protein